MKILVTGATGFVGSHIAKKLHDDGHYVIGTGVSTERKVPYVDKILNLHFDGIDWGAVKDVDVIFHESANNETRCMDETEMYKANLHGPRHLFVEAYFRGCRKFVYASSTAVYGDSLAPYIEDETKINPLTPYAKSKLEFEDWATNEFALDAPWGSTIVVGLRYCNVYGVGEDHKGKRMSMIGQLIRSMLQKKNPKLFKHGKQQRDWVHVSDVVEANMLAMDSDTTGIYNVGSGVATTFNRLVDIIYGETEIDWIDCPFENEYQKHTCCDLKKIKDALGYKPQIDIEKGIRNYIMSYIEELRASSVLDHISSIDI